MHAEDLKGARPDEWWSPAYEFVGVVAASGGGGRGDANRSAAASPAATSALAIVTDPAGASIQVDGAARGVAPLNVAATVGAEVEIRAELAGHVATTERVRMGAEPATVRLTLVPIVDAGVAADAPPAVGLDAAAPIDAGALDARPRRDRPRTPPSGQRDTFDPDGVIGP